VLEREWNVDNNKVSDVSLRDAVSLSSVLAFDFDFYDEDLVVFITWR
jgi:hypothetical protein